MRQKTFLSIFIFGSMILVMAFQNCAKHNFTKPPEAVATGTTAEPSAITGTDGGPTDIKSQDFKVSFTNQTAPLDMVWVIDNSGSMAEEAALVRDNFSAFLTTLNKNSNFRLLLISGTLGPRGVTLPTSFNSATHKQIERSVGSTNAAQVLLDEGVTALPGFFRTDSKKVVIFVTDDDSGLPAMDFYKKLETNFKWIPQDISISSFIAIDQATSPCLARPGAEYKTLASLSGGKTYNICQTNWSAHFTSIIDSSLSKAVRRYTLAHTVTEVVDVKVDGQVIASNTYSISGKTVTLADSVSLGENSVVVIRYK